MPIYHLTVAVSIEADTEAQAVQTALATLSEGACEVNSQTKTRFGYVDANSFDTLECELDEECRVEEPDACSLYKAHRDEQLLGGF